MCIHKNGLRTRFLPPNIQLKKLQIQRSVLVPLNENHCGFSVLRIMGGIKEIGNKFHPFDHTYNGTMNINVS